MSRSSSSGVCSSSRACSTCATLESVESIGLRELRQNASELVRRVESGEELTITVAGRPSARLVPLAPASTSPRTWRTYEQIADLWSGVSDSEWEADRDRIDQTLRDPWAQ
ncbi:type II toxin-antitoxin system Phd/YefM family antitoxin [Nocardia sp. NPDC006044]|uniref:type II toxin-antitoxin system Phd/YefM family antitoxin n=1 Tax=Nocardia sp. NPDC006044 TaxID=3364306 RepID=UPI0036A498BB